MESTDENEYPHPVKLTREEISGSIFSHEDVDKYTENDVEVTNFTMLESSDEHFATGIYSSPACKENHPDGYGMDEFMFFLTGGVTLTSEDGTVTEIVAGEAVSLTREWKGTWDTDGYTKLWVSYDRDGSAAE